MMTNLFRKVRPRMKLIDLMRILERIKSSEALRPQSDPLPLPRFRTSRLSSMAPSHGAIFSSSVPGRNPISSPTEMVARVMMISLKRLCSIVWVRPAASVSSVLPVPAWPSSVTKSMFGSIRRLSAKACSLFLALMPQTVCFGLR